MTTVAETQPIVNVKSLAHQFERQCNGKTTALSTSKSNTSICPPPLPAKPRCVHPTRSRSIKKPAFAPPPQPKNRSTSTEDAYNVYDITFSTIPRRRGRQQRHLTVEVFAALNDGVEGEEEVHGVVDSDDGVSPQDCNNIYEDIEDYFEQQLQHNASPARAGGQTKMAQRTAPSLLEAIESEMKLGLLDGDPYGTQEEVAVVPTAEPEIYTESGDNKSSTNYDDSGSSNAYNDCIYAMDSDEERSTKVAPLRPPRRRREQHLRNSLVPCTTSAEASTSAQNGHHNMAASMCVPVIEHGSQGGIVDKMVGRFDTLRRRVRSMADSSILLQQHRSIERNPTLPNQNSADSDWDDESWSEGEEASTSFDSAHKTKEEEQLKILIGSPTRDLMNENQTISPSNLKHQSYILEQPLYQHLIIAPTVNDNTLASSSSGIGEEVTSAAVSSSIVRKGSLREQFVGVSQLGSQRTLWCELSQVRSTPILGELTTDELKCQESIFELITSEASYLRSLNVLITHFMAAIQLSGNTTLALSVIDKRQRLHLFSNILAIRDASEHFMSQLEDRMESNVLLAEDICDLFADHLRAHASVYVKYCSYQYYQERTFKQLKTENTPFCNVLFQLECAKQCEGLDMRSFLTLPTQRITRYPLLLLAIVQRGDAAISQAAQRALLVANHCVNDCNEGARKLYRIEQLITLDARLVYNNKLLRRLPIVSNTRHIVKEGVLTQLCPHRHQSLNSNMLNNIVSRSNSINRTLYVILLTDTLIIAKKRRKSDQLIVLDYCNRAFVQVEPLEVGCAQVNLKAVESLREPLCRSPHLILCTLMHNAYGKQCEFVLTGETETERQRWINAIQPPQTGEPHERIYALWDCPQVKAVYAYESQDNDELSLRVGDVMNVTRKMDDGWYEGETVTNGKYGWFPSTYVVEIVNDHVRARNYRQRLKIIHHAENVLCSTMGHGGEQKRVSFNDDTMTLARRKLSKSITNISSYFARAKLSAVPQERNHYRQARRARNMSNPHL